MKELLLEGLFIKIKVSFKFISYKQEHALWETQSL